MIEVLEEAPGGINPLQIFDAVRLRCPDLGLTTVYRTLEVLDEIGALRRVHGPNHCDTFVLTEAHHGHAVVCGECGRVSEFTHCDMKAVIEAAAAQTGYRITEHVLQLNGICAACQRGHHQRKGTMP